MLASKTLSDGTVENWVWDGLALIRRGDDIYVNEPHISGGVPIVSKTKEGVRYHEHDFLGTTLWSMDTKGKVVKDYQDTTIFGEGSIQHDRSARFTGKPYDEDLQAYVFPFRNYDAFTAHWRTADPAGYPDGVNQHFYACVPTYGLDIFGLAEAALYGRSVQNTLGAFTHTSSRLAVTASEYGTLTTRQQSYFARDSNTGQLLTDAKGNYYATVSGFEKSNSWVPFDTSLDVRANDATDAPGKTSKIGDIEANNMLDFVKGYLDDTYAYQQNQTQLDYDWFPNNPDETNCNSYQGSTIRRNNGKIVDENGKEIPVNATGFGHDVDGKYFKAIER